MTLRQILQQRGFGYVSIFGNRAEDIYFNCVKELCEVLGYIYQNIKRLDAEIPDTHIPLLHKIIPNYPISNGYTSSGHDMKWAPQFRIYLSTTRNCPKVLLARKQNDNQMRFTGSMFIEACLFLGFLPGSEQFPDLILPTIKQMFPNVNEEQSFDYGCQLASR